MRILSRVDTIIERIRWFVGGAIFAITARWAWLAWRDRRGVDTRELAAEDPVTGLRLRTRLTPDELVAARQAERSVELVG